MPSKTTAKDFFIYLGVIIGLYVSSVSFLILVFQIIDKVFPLTGEYLGDIDSSIRSALATLIIFFPAFVYVAYVANNDLKLNPDKKDMWIRRWMIFLTLFLAGLTIAIDLSTLIYRFLGAEDLSLRFFLKVFFVLAVAVTIFKSTMHDLHRISFEYAKGMKIGLICVSLFILASIVYGIVLIGSPSSQRAKKMDAMRINNLSSIQNQIVYTQWENKGEVPESLEVLKDPISGYSLPTDPETKTNYEYKKLSKNSFELCATFKTEASMSTDATAEAKSATYPYQAGSIDQNWQHSVGRTCFTRTIDEKLYPINKSLKQ